MVRAALPALTAKRLEITRADLPGDPPYVLADAFCPSHGVVILAARHQSLRRRRRR